MHPLPVASAALVWAALGLLIAPEARAADDRSPAAAFGLGRSSFPMPPAAAPVAVLPRPLASSGPVTPESEDLRAGKAGAGGAPGWEPLRWGGSASAGRASPVLVASPLNRPAGPSDPDTRIGGGLTVPSDTYRGIGGTRLRASLAFLAPDAVNVGLFYAIDDRWTVGLVGQRLRQERKVELEGQLIDPGDLGSFIPGFSIREETTSLSFGPFAQYRVFRERGLRPEVHVAAYALAWGRLTSASTQYSNPGLMIDAAEEAASEGERADRYGTVFLSASKRLPWFDDSAFLQGVRAYGGAGYGVRTGMRYAVALTGEGDPRVKVVREDVTRHSFVGWIGAEAALPEHLSVYAELFTGDECEAGYGVGLRWNSPIGITFSIGFSDCLASTPQRMLDLVYLPGGVGGQPSIVSGGGGLDGGGLGHQSSFDEDDDRRSRR